VIAAAIIYASSKVIEYWPANLVAGIYNWFAAPARLTRGELVIWPLQVVAGALIVYAIALSIRSQIMKRRGHPQVVAQADAQPSEDGEPNESPKFEPEKFELTPPRSRALIGLLQRVDARTTLHDLYQFVVEVGPYRDIRTTKALLQHDMEEAEGAGIVSIDRVGPLTAFYNLTAPAGRNWVLSKESELRAKASEGMERINPRYF
jgi:hypothetical protein